MHLCGSAGHVRSLSLCRATRFVRDPAQRFVTRESAETIFRGLRTRKKITRTQCFSCFLFLLFLQVNAQSSYRRSITSASTIDVTAWTFENCVSRESDG